MVDDFAIAEPSPESLFGDKDMLVAPLLAANMHNHISGFLDGSIAYGSLGEDVVAGWRTFSRTLLGRVVLPPGFAPCASSVPVTRLSNLHALAAQPSVDGCHWYAGFVPAVTVTFALDNERVRLCGEGVESKEPCIEPFSRDLAASPRGKGQI